MSEKLLQAMGTVRYLYHKFNDGSEVFLKDNVWTIQHNDGRAERSTRKSVVEHAMSADAKAFELVVFSALLDEAVYGNFIVEKAQEILGPDAVAKAIDGHKIFERKMLETINNILKPKLAPKLTLIRGEHNCSTDSKSGPNLKLIQGEKNEQG